MTTPLRLLALDLGAESGRGVVGSLDGDLLSLAEVHRFPNVPVSLGGTLHWDFLRLFGDLLVAIRSAASAGPIASVGVDTWGVDFGLIDARGRLMANPVHYGMRGQRGSWRGSSRGFHAKRSTAGPGSSSCRSTRSASSWR